MDLRGLWAGGLGVDAYNQKVAILTPTSCKVYASNTWNIEPRDKAWEGFYRSSPVSFSTTWQGSKWSSTGITYPFLDKDKEPEKKNDKKNEKEKILLLGAAGGPIAGGMSIQMFHNQFFKEEMIDVGRLVS